MTEGSPGAVFVLRSGQAVLVRAVNDVVAYAGPVAERTELYYADGEVKSFRTGDCR